MSLGVFLEISERCKFLKECDIERNLHIHWLRLVKEKNDEQVGISQLIFKVRALALP